MMGCSWLLILGLVLNVAHCLEILGAGETMLEVQQNITAVLGEDAYLSCRYLGSDEVDSALWKRQYNSKSKTRLAGYRSGKPFSSHKRFSEPVSATNLTVKINASSVEDEGEYECEVATATVDYTERVFLTVVARPDIHVLVSAETINGSHYQSVSCSTVGGRPPPQISWLVNNLPPLDPLFAVNVTETAHPNGTSTLSSHLHFPTLLLDEDSVTCVVQHPTLPNPKRTTVRVETYKNPGPCVDKSEFSYCSPHGYDPLSISQSSQLVCPRCVHTSLKNCSFVRPNVTIKAEMIQDGGSDFWVVSCVSSGGRPETDISLALDRDEELQRQNSTDSDTQTRSVLLPATKYEGRNVTCVFQHPKFTHKVSRVITLPTFYISGVQLLNSELGSNSDDVQEPESVELLEGQSDTSISLQVNGNVPRFNVTCKRDGGPLPEGVELVDSSLRVQGAVGDQHAGLYECFFSYHHLQAELKFNITVKPHVIQPVPPTIRVDLQTEDGRGVIECSAADAVPAANISWLLPEGVSGVSWFNFTSHNGSHSVRGVLLLPACSPWELTAECVINHPAFEEPQNRSITLPLCARPNITISSHTEWKDGHEFTNVNCSVDSVATAATITWRVGDGDSNITGLSETEGQAGGLVSARSTLHFLSSLYSGQNLTCTVEHPSLEVPEKRTAHVLAHRAHLLSVSLQRQHDSSLWLAVCDCRGEGVGTNLAWVLPENARSQTSLQSEYEGQIQKARLTYQFSLAHHEGQNLTCVYHYENGRTVETLHVPKYYISSVRVLNRTTPLQSRYGGEATTRRLSLQENHSKQRVLLRVEGNVPEYNLNCQRSDGSSVQMDRDAMVFQSELTEQDEGLYTCWASFYHHTASVNIHVEVMSEDRVFALATIICISSASAIAIILVVTLWVCCKANGRKQYKEQEALSALTALMQEPGSPEVKKPPATGEVSKEYAHLVSYSIVIDVKSTV